MAATQSGNLQRIAAGRNLCCLAQICFQINYTGGTGNDVVLTRIVTLEIEPVSSTGVRVLWVTNGTAGFSLESNTNLSTTNWCSRLRHPSLWHEKTS
jgi:hypothetical protein